MIREFSSFRDSSGFVFQADKEIYRYISVEYKNNYDFACVSGLYDLLMEKQLLIKHHEINADKFDKTAYKILQVDKIPFISYPYEWSFSEYKDAALLTLKIQKRALLKGMSLKDASAYNIQFKDGKPIFIDTLSFEKLEESHPWVAYKQFCQHFLAPLALMYYKDERLNTLMKNYIDGIPLDLASRLLPKITSFGILSHIHMNAMFQKMYASSRKDKSNFGGMNLKKHIALVENLYRTILSFKKRNSQTEWKDYYDFKNYDDTAFAHKGDILLKFLNQIQKPELIWDIGANNGYFSKIASETGAQVIAFDIDSEAVDQNYKNSERPTQVLPLLLDILNPSPSIGWANKERLSINQRGCPDAIMALALIHHLSISNNIPFDYVAAYFSSLSKYLIIEFVPKEDSQVQILLSSRKDIFPNYNQAFFEKCFQKYYTILESQNVKNSKRVMYLMVSKN